MSIRFLKLWLMGGYNPETDTREKHMKDDSKNMTKAYKQNQLEIPDNHWLDQRVQEEENKLKA